MLSSDRRLAYRIPFEIFLTHYIDDKKFRGLTTNLSETGLFMNRVAGRSVRAGKRQVVALELELPGTEETIWARGEVCYGESDDMCEGTGIRFTGIAKAHARLLRDYCVDSRRSHLGSLLARIGA